MLGDAIGSVIRAVFVTAFLKPCYQWLHDEIGFGQMVKGLVLVAICWLFTLSTLGALLMLLLYLMA